MSYKEYDKPENKDKGKGGTETEVNENRQEGTGGR